jgi:excinuclease UvrABC nuclease subunit
MSGAAVIHEQLRNGGFVAVGKFSAGANKLLELEGTVPDAPGVYVFILNDQVVYVGMSVASLRARLASYTRHRKAYTREIFTLLRSALDEGAQISVMIATPEPTTWNGWPVDAVTGLEVGLIRHFRPTWNKTLRTEQHLASALGER